jgi:cation:H+ antiporter
MWWIYPLYALDLAAMVFLSMELGNLVDMLDKKTKISGAFIGGVLLAAVTSLPELFTAFSSVLLVHNASYVVGDILGSIIFDLVVLAIETFIWVKHFHEAKFQPWHVINGTFCLAMYGAAAYAFFVPSAYQPMLGDINAISFIIFALYIITLFIQPKTSDEEEEEEKEEIGWSLKRIWVLFALCSVLLIGSSIALTYLTDAIQKEIPALSGSVAGALLLGIGTSVPEIISTAQLFRKKNYDAGFGNMIGSCTFDFAILAFADFISWHQFDEGLSNVVERGVYIAETDAIQFEIAGIAVCAAIILFCLLRAKTNLFTSHKKIGYALTGILAVGCTAAYVLVFAL